MVDEPVVPAVEPEEAAQDAATEPASPPWGDDFDAQRAWDTITKLRGFEKQAKEFERIQSDEDARAEWLKSHGYEFEDEPEVPDEELFDDEDPVAPLKSEVEELKQWRAQQEAERAAQAIRKDLETFNEESGWDLDDDDRRRIEYDARLLGGDKGFGPQELKKAHAAYIARLNRAADAGVERAKAPKKKAPHVPAAGQAATEVPNLDDHSERVRHMMERLSGGN